MKNTFAAIAFIALSGPALADYVRVEATGTVAEAADRLAAAIEKAGARVFARVPHSKGAESAGMELQDAELLIFGNPQLGTPALQDDIRAGLVLPLRVLVHDDAGQTVMSYEDVSAMFDDLEIPADAGYRAKMAGALANLTGAAAN